MLADGIKCSPMWLRKALIVFFEKTARLYPDKFYIKTQFYLRMGYRLDLETPKTLSEKIQWLKLYNRQPYYSSLVDKYEVKEIVAKAIGEKYIIPTIAKWETPKQIEWDMLPNQFVLKTTHGGGNLGVVLCKDKHAFNKSDAISKLRRAYAQDIFLSFREWPYKNIKKQVIAERFMEQENGFHLIDYKFFCFNGKPQYIYVSQYQEGTNKTISKFMTTEWEQSFVHWKDDLEEDLLPQKPEKLEEMIHISEMLSKDIPLVRVDLYQINSQVYFSELTFFPSSGMKPYYSYECDLKLGDMLVLPAKYSNRYDTK